MNFRDISGTTLDVPNWKLQQTLHIGPRYRDNGTALPSNPAEIICGINGLFFFFF